MTSFDFTSLFETDPLGRQALFQSFLPTNTNPLQADQFQGLFQPTFSQFLGQIGSQIRAGQAPTQTFTDFLESDQFNPTRALLRLPGSGASRTPTIFRF